MAKTRCVLSLFALILAGCDTVVVEAPFGTQANKQTIESLCGAWEDGNGNVFHAEPDGEGGLIVGTIRWDQGENRFAAINTPMSVRSVGDRVLLFFPGDEGSTDRYMFVWLASIDAMQIRGRPPDPKAFRLAVEQSEVNGRISLRKNDHFDVSLTASEELITALGGDEGDKFFESEQGAPLTRIGTRNGG